MNRARQGCALFLGLFFPLAVALGQYSFTDQNPVSSVSGQFVVASLSAGGAAPRDADLEADTNLIHLNTALLAVAAERFKSSLRQQLGIPAQDPLVGQNLSAAASGPVGGRDRDHHRRPVSQSLELHGGIAGPDFAATLCAGFVRRAAAGMGQPHGRAGGPFRRVARLAGGWAGRAVAGRGPRGDLADGARRPERPDGRGPDQPVRTRGGCAGRRAAHPAKPARADLRSIELAHGRPVGKPGWRRLFCERPGVPIGIVEP